MGKKIEINMSAREKNDAAAKKNREIFNNRSLRVFNIISSPGSGKTSILEYAAEKLGSKLAVIVGDVFTTQDADRINKKGCVAVQVETGGGCHLNAEMVRDAYEQLDTKKTEILVIENVGNLVCPSTYDLGEDKKIAVISLPEGDEKPSKYPALFNRADAVIINKIDLAPFVDFNIERAESDCRKLNKDVRVIRTSVKTGEGMDSFIDYLEKR
ncbi:MAG: hydrogenase nickel incorporation protein HypB [Fibrobacterota bacterium]